MSDFVHLHLHSEYSLLDGACKIAEIPKYAKKLGHKAVAITDHGVMYGVVDFYRACVAEGIKPIIGCEVYVAQRTRFDRSPELDLEKRHLVLLVKNETGYKNLIAMVSKSFTEGFYSKPGVDMELLETYHEGLVALSGCIGGYIPQCLLSANSAEALKYAQKLDSVFGRGNFYLELQDHGLAAQKTVNAGLLALSKKTGIPMVATNDAHYLEKSDARSQAVLTCIQTASVITDGRPLGFETDEFYYKSTEEMERLFEAYPDAIENTVRIADMCSFDFDFKSRYIPSFTPENGMKPDDYIKKLTADGLDDRLKKGEIVYSDKLTAEDYKRRVDYELVVITSLKYSEYFLIVWDFVNFAKTNKIPTGPGRGSGAGSLVAYLLRITDIDPLKYNLLFETFLNPERVSMPDFDIDFCYDRRGEVIQYVTGKYGEDHVSQIVTFGTLAARAAVRDVGRALGMSYADVDAVARLIPQKLGITLDEAMKEPELQKMYESSERVRDLIDTSKALEGMPRHASTHAAGVVITDRPVAEYVPLSKNDDTIVTQFDMDTIASLGLLKFDFLALRYLTIIDNAQKQVRETEPDFDIERVPLDDAATYELISSGHTDGMFQLESGGMRTMLTNLKPACIEDIMVAIALYRPGPMDSIPRFIENRRSRDKIVYKNDILRDILEETCGCIVYQEQVMQIFRFVAKYSYGKADIVRRAIAKKKQGVIESERETFIAGAGQSGMSEEDAASLFEEMIDFSNYGFKKSHAACYALVSYRTAYLKAHYPAMYLASLLDTVLGNTGKLAQYTGECSRLKIKILPPDINESRASFHVVNGNIRFGLRFIKNVGQSFAETVAAERERNGSYSSLEDFIGRMQAGELNKRALEGLIMAGAFDGLGVYRSRLLASYEKLLEINAARGTRNIGGQLDMFSAGEGKRHAPPGFEYPELPELSLRERLNLEKESAGIYLSGHMLDEYSKHIAALPTAAVSDIAASFSEDLEAGGEAKYHEKDVVTVAGIITRKVVKTTKSGDGMAFVTLEDRSGEMELVIFPRVLEQCGRLLGFDSAVYASGEISVREDEAPKLLVRTLDALMPDAQFANKPQTEPAQSMGYQPPPKQNTPQTLYLRVENMECPAFRRALAVCEIFEGPVQVAFYDMSAKKYIKSSVRTAPTIFVQTELSELLGRQNVVLK